MSDVIPTHELEAGSWIKGQLEDATSLKAHLDLIPESASLPGFRYQCQLRDDVHTVAGHIAISKFRFLVVATVQGQHIGEGPNGLATLANKITEALHLQSGSTPGALILACIRRETYTQTENSGGDIIRHAGGIFEITVQGLPV